MQYVIPMSRRFRVE